MNWPEAFSTVGVVWAIAWAWVYTFKAFVNIHEECDSTRRDDGE